METEPNTDQTRSTKPLGSLGRDEMNLAEFPIALLTDRVPKAQTEAIYQDEIYDDRTGRTLTRRLIIKAGGYGLTTAADDEVILALIQLTRQKNNFTQRRVEFSRLELIRLLNWPSHGASYERILLSLQRWTSVYLQYENAWRDNKTKTWTSPKGFHIIDNFELNDSRNSGEQFDLLQSNVVWNEVIFESFQAGYLKPLDYDLCTGLRNSTAKRLYRFLDKRFHHKADWEFDLKELAHMHIGLGKNYEGPAHLKRNLQPAIAELEQVGFLEPMSKDRFFREGKIWKVRLAQKSPAIAGNVSSTGLIPTNDEPTRLAAELVMRGVTHKTAEELVKRHQSEAITTKIEEFDFLVSKQDKKVSKSPAGYLVKSIDDKYAQPKGYIPLSERERLTQAEREAEEARRRQHADDARERKLAERVKSYRQAQTAEQLAQLEAMAIGQATEETRRSLEDPALKPFKKTLLSRLVNEHIARLLQAEEKLSEPA